MTSYSQKESLKQVYICDPCGKSCDSLTFDKSGICPHCGMALVEKSTRQIKTEAFSFSFANKKYSGLLDMPEEAPRSIVIIIPGSGQTHFAKDNSFYALRSSLVNLGFAVCVWDKAGCGESEGQFDNEQPVENSADEALAAISELKHQKRPGSERIGLWGISRGGWICPLIIERYSGINFWISVSGVDSLDNSRFSLEKNLKIEGRTHSEIKQLMTEFDYCYKYLRSGTTYEEFMSGTKTLFQDPYCKSLGMGLPSKKELSDIQEYYKKSGFTYDNGTGMQILVSNFDQTLSKVNCPVLAIFGENDTQVNWRQTKNLYEKTIGKNTKPNLTIKVLPNCNHNMQKCDTGGMFENLEKYKWQACDSYYDVMKIWLHGQGFVDTMTKK